MGVLADWTTGQVGLALKNSKEFVAAGMIVRGRGGGVLVVLTGYVGCRGYGGSLGRIEDTLLSPTTATR